MQDEKCAPTWFASSWSSCSASCKSVATGVQTRKVYCGVVRLGKGGSGNDSSIEQGSGDDGGSGSGDGGQYQSSSIEIVPDEECPTELRYACINITVENMSKLRCAEKKMRYH